MTAGGEAGSRLAEELAVPVSGDTIIRRVKSSPTEAEPSVRCLGIDDFAFRRGHNYGTILIDLERGCVIDILKSRESADVEAWLKAHPGIEVITRDRSSAYANAASSGAPQAKQVADRWHLLKNFREASERLLDQRRKTVQKHLKSKPFPAAELELPTFQDVSVPDEPTVSPHSAREQARESKRQEKVEHYTRVHELHVAGESIRQIAMLLDLDRETVTLYLQADSFPDRQVTSRARESTKIRGPTLLRFPCRPASPRLLAFFFAHREVVLRRRVLSLLAPQGRLYSGQRSSGRSNPVIGTFEMRHQVHFGWRRVIDRCVVPDVSAVHLGNDDGVGQRLLDGSGVSTSQLGPTATHIPDERLEHLTLGEERRPHGEHRQVLIFHGPPDGRVPG